MGSRGARIKFCARRDWELPETLALPPGPPFGPSMRFQPSNLHMQNSIATFAFDESVPVVEANIARVLARLFDMRHSIDSSVGREKIWRYASELLPKRRAALHNSALMDLGALICTARAPRCRSCPVRKLCRAKNPISLPKRRSQPKIEIKMEPHSFIFRRDRILLEKSRDRWRERDRRERHLYYG